MTEQKSVAEIVYDVLDASGALDAPGGKVIKSVVQEVRKRKLAYARDILLEQMKRGNKTMIDAAALEDVVSILYRYTRAALEGAARVNLKLLAQVISGKGLDGKLTANKFLSYADIISSLSLEEIQVLGNMAQKKKVASYEERRTVEAKIAKSESVLQSLVRTGLVAFEQTVSVEDQDDWKASDKYVSGIHTQYYLTSLMDEICQFVSFDEELASKAGNADSGSAA
jgi:hypothetical protein